MYVFGRVTQAVSVKRHVLSAQRSCGLLGLETCMSGRICWQLRGRSARPATKPSQFLINLVILTALFDLEPSPQYCKRRTSLVAWHDPDLTSLHVACRNSRMDTGLRPRFCPGGPLTGGGMDRMGNLGWRLKQSPVFNDSADARYFRFL